MRDKYSCDGFPRVIEFFVPGYPKSANWTPNKDKRGGRVWREKLTAAAEKARKEFGKIDGPVRVTYEFAIPTKFKNQQRNRESGLLIKIETISGDYKYGTPDIDNLVKMANDCIKKILIDNDNAIVDLRAIKRHGKLIHPSASRSRQ